jgi:hypothetical protein
MLINRGVSRVHTEEETCGQDPDTPDDHNGVDVGGGVSDQPVGSHKVKGHSMRLQYSMVDHNIHSTSREADKNINRHKVLTTTSFCVAFVLLFIRNIWTC